MGGAFGDCGLLMVGVEYSNAPACKCICKCVCVCLTAVRALIDLFTLGFSLFNLALLSITCRNAFI